MCKILPHDRFVRKGADIFMEQTISLVDALTGVDIKIDNIDGTSFRVATEEGEVIKPGDKKIIPEKGLPFY